MMAYRLCWEKKSSLCFFVKIKSFAQFEMTTMILSEFFTLPKGKIFSKGMKLIFIEDLTEEEISGRSLCENLYGISVSIRNLLSRRFCEQNILRRKLFKISMLFYSQNLREIFKRKSINFSPKPRSHEDLIFLRSLRS